MLKEPNSASDTDAKRRALLAGAGALLVVSLGAGAEQAERRIIPKIGVMWLGRPPSRPLPPTSPLVMLGESLRALGYFEGRNIEVESRFGLGDAIFRQAADLIRLRVDVLVAMSTAAAWAAKSSTTAVPIVFSIAGDPVKFGLVKSLARPDGNLTGIYALTGEHGAKRLGLLREAVPRATHIAILWNPSDPLSLAEFRDTQDAARNTNVGLVPIDIRTGNDIENAFGVAKKVDATALSVLTSPVIVTNLQRVAQLSLANRLPAIAGYPAFAELGGLMGYGASDSEMLRRTAAYVDKIIKGAKPADLPVEQAQKFELSINLKTARALRLTIPQSLLQRADQVIE